MKRLHIILLLSMLLAGGYAGAQRINAYVAAGAAASQVEGDELKGFDKWGFHGGVGAFVRLTESGRWNLSVEADYTRRGIYNNSHSYENLYNINLPLDYVDIPLTVYFRDPFGGILIGVGLTYSRLVRQPHGTIAYNDNYFVPDTSDMKFLKNDLAIAGELRFTIWSGLQMSIRYQYSIIAVKKDWMFIERSNDSRPDLVKHNDCYNSSATVRLIWQFGAQEESRASRRRR